MTTPMRGEKAADAVREFAADQLKIIGGFWGPKFAPVTEHPGFKKALKITGEVNNQLMNNPASPMYRTAQTMNAIGQATELANQGISKVTNVDPLWTGAGLFVAETLATGGSGTLRKVGKTALGKTDDALRATLRALPAEKVGATGRSLNPKGRGGVRGKPKPPLSKPDAGGLKIAAQGPDPTPAQAQRMTRKEYKAEAVRQHSKHYGNLPTSQVKENLGGPYKIRDKVTGELTGDIARPQSAKGQTDIVMPSKSSRDKRGAKRVGKDKIKPDEVQKLADKYGQPPEVVESFIQKQKEGFKAVENRVKAINARIKKNQSYFDDKYGENFGANIGHGKASETFDAVQGGANIRSNVDVENSRLNMGRGNSDEISDEFNRAIGRSINLEEEFLKHIDPDLQQFHDAFNFGRHQKDQIIEHVRSNMNTDVNWKIRADNGKLLFKSKEEFLINEYMEKLLK